VRWPRRVMSFLFLAFFLAGPPVVLVRFVGWPIQGWPGLQQARAWVSHPLTEQTLTFGLAVLAWLVWLLLAGTVVLRLLARMRAVARWLRRLPLPTPMQATATGIAGAAVFGVGTDATTAPQSDAPPPTATGALDHHVGDESGSPPHQPDAPVRPVSDGVTLPGGWVPQTTAEHIATAGALVWLRRRRSYRPSPPGSATRDDADLTPLPGTITVVQAALAPPIADDLYPEQPAPARTEQVPGTPCSDQSSPVADLPPGGVGLTGVGAADAARGVLVTVLLHGLRHPAGEVRLVTTTADLTTLLGSASALLHRVPGLRLTSSAEDAVAVLEAELRRRTQPGADHAAAVRDGPLVLLTHTPTTPDTATRLATALGNSGGAVTAVLLGAWPHATTWRTDATGYTHDPREPDLPGPRLCVLDAVATTDLLTVISQAHPNQSNAHPPIPAEERPPAPHPPIPRQATGNDRPITPHVADLRRRRCDLRVLGVPALLCDGIPVTVRRSAAMQALVFLAVHRQGATSRQLTEAIWPGLPAHTVTGRLYTTLSELRTTTRAASGLTIVDHHNDRYQLVHDHVDADLWRLHAAVDDAATAFVGRASACRAIIDSYTGDLGTGQPWPWLAPAREVTRRLVIDAYAALAAAQTDPHRTLALLQDAIRVDPLNEDLHRQALHVLAALGNHAAVEDLLDSHNRRLAAARLEPSDALRRIAAQLW
jgi:DNA-binding SARP family transcriptional activator